MAGDALLEDINYTNKVLLKVNGLEFYFITSEQYARIDNNINEAAGIILRLCRCYEHVLLEALVPRTDLVKYVIKELGPVETKKFSVYSPCVLLPCELLDKLNEKK